MSTAVAGQLSLKHVPAALLLALPLLVALGAGVSAADAATPEAKWPADEAVRAGMAAIRKATLDSHTLVTHRRMPPEAARKFAVDIKRHVDGIRAGAKMPAAAQPALEALLQDIAEGAEAVEGRSTALSPIDGIIGIDAALADYPRQFDDPEWTPLR